VKVLVALLCLTGAAHAADPSSPMTIENCLEINGALKALDGTYDVVVKDGAKTTVAHAKYKLGSAWGTVALNLTALAPIATAQEQASKRMIAEITGDEGGSFARYIDQDHPEKGETRQFKEYMKKVQVFLDRPCNIELATIKKGDLKISDENPIPLTIQLALGRILE
jgi:copper chaperone CopZ